MSGHWCPPTSTPEVAAYNIDSSLHPELLQQQQTYQDGLEQSMMPMVQPMYLQSHQYYASPLQQSPPLGYHTSQAQQWTAPVVPSNYGRGTTSPIAFPSYTDAPQFLTEPAFAGPSITSTRYLSPEEVEPSRSSRAASNASEVSLSDVSRSTSPNASEMAKWGRRNANGSWSCSWASCSSSSTFTRGCDLRKHYKRHTKSLFCSYEGCPQATEGGFSSKKDRARHEASHNPNVACEWPNCDRMFSRVDNMKDHVRRVHRRGQR